MIFKKAFLCCAALFFTLFAENSLAAASLPSVNVDGRGVSARALFGEPPVDKPVPVRSAAAAPAPAKKAGAPSPKPVAAAKQNAPRDVLTPKRPNVDLWAKSRDSDNVAPAAPERVASARVGKPPRLPEPKPSVLWDEDYGLPEEDSAFAAPRPTFDNMFATVRSGGVQPARPKMANPYASRAHPGATPTTADASGIRAQQKAPDVTKPTSTIQNRFMPARRAATAGAIAPAARKSAPMAEDAESKESESNLEARISNLENMLVRAVNASQNEVAVRQMIVPLDDDGITRRVVKVEADDGFARSAEPQARAVGNSQHAADDEIPLSQLSPMQLKRAFQKTYVSENKHLSTYKIDDRFDVVSDVSYAMQGFDSSRDLSEAGGVRPLEIKLSFRGNDSALSRDNFTLLSEYAGIVASNPKRAIQISIPERVTKSLDGRKLAARRLAIVEQVLRDNGVSDQRVIPVLSQRNDEAFVLRMISSDMYQTLSERQRDMFGDTVSSKSYRSLSW